MRGGTRPVLLAAALALAAMAIWWPGVATYDTVAIYREVLSGSYDDWHPPVLARVWAVLHALGPGTAPLFVLQVAGYWAGLGLIAGGLARSGRARAGWAVLLLGAMPLFAGWQAVVLKDAQMVAALLAATGLAAWWRLAGRRLPVLAVAGVIALLAYAALLRANGVFAAAPLAVLLLGPRWRWWQQAAAVAGLSAIVLTVSAPINHDLLAAQRTSVGQTLPLFDLAGIAHFAGTGDGLTVPEYRMIEARHCYQPFFWDPLGDTAHCGAIAARFAGIAPKAVTRMWLLAIVRHPLAYAAHRLAHLNATDRLFVPQGWGAAAPPVADEPNALGLTGPGWAARIAAVIAGWSALTPLAWPVLWIVVAGAALLGARRRPQGPIRDLARALALSALTLEASFAVVSIASDLRYHLWPMLAAALAAILVSAGHRPARAELLGFAAALALVVVAGAVSRSVLPRAPDGYQPMLGWDGADARRAIPVARLRTTVLR